MARPSEMSIPKEHACLYPHCARLSPERGADLGRGLPPGRVDSPWGMGASPPPTPTPRKQISPQVAPAPLLGRGQLDPLHPGIFGAGDTAGDRGGSGVHCTLLLSEKPSDKSPGALV